MRLLITRHMRRYDVHAVDVASVKTMLDERERAGAR